MQRRLFFGLSLLVVLAALDQPSRAATCSLGLIYFTLGPPIRGTLRDTVTLSADDSTWYQYQIFTQTDGGGYNGLDPVSFTPQWSGYQDVNMQWASGHRYDYYFVNQGNWWNNGQFATWQCTTNTITVDTR